MRNENEEQSVTLPNMPYTQLLQMTGGDQLIPGFYHQSSSIHDFGVPTGDSLDSGYEEVDPFDKGPQYHSSNDIDFAQSCTMNPLNTTTTMDFGTYGYAAPIVQQSSSEFNAYPTSTEVAASFQPMLDSTNPYKQYHQSPSLADLSEDGLTGSVASDSPQQASAKIEVSPRQRQRPLWSDGPAMLKRRATEGSMEDVKCKVEEQQTPKTAPSRGRPRKRIPHTAVERRYRENLNAHLEKLRSAVPNLTAAQRRKSTDGADPMKPSKCEVLMGAVDYIKRLEEDNARLRLKLG